MGIDIQQARFLYHARDHGVRFGRVGVLARQSVMASREQFDEWLGAEPEARVAAGRQAFADMAGCYAEPFLKFLGAEEITSFDASDYEGATVVHDFNEPMPERFHKQFDAVVDSGSLEHIFNFPVAVKNLMQMVKPGGHLLVMTPANNFCGHGFYQFSPELFYRLLGGANGFEVRRMLLAECFSDAFWWEVPDPITLHRRVTFENRYWTHLYVIAQRVTDKPILLRSPQQSDYAAAWDQAAGNGSAAPAAESYPWKAEAEGYWERHRRKLATSFQQRWLKYVKFRGKDRELFMKSKIFQRAEGP